MSGAVCRIVPYQREHRDGVLSTVRAVYDEYGFTWEADGYHRDLYDVEGHYLTPGGMFWAVLDGQRTEGDLIVGCVGVLVHGRESELHRMYLLKAYRGRGLGRRLLETCIAYAKQHGCDSMRLWSDVKLVDGHRLYQKFGFVKQGQRICDDPDQSLEDGFLKEPL